jgi:hypothetical protein
MDPNANLAEQLALANAIVEDDQPSLEDVMRLAELIHDLNDWLTRGGALPRAWFRS